MRCLLLYFREAIHFCKLFSQLDRSQSPMVVVFMSSFSHIGFLASKSDFIHLCVFVHWNVHESGHNYRISDCA